MGGFSGLAGALALAVIALPVVVRTTEDMLLLVITNHLEQSCQKKHQKPLMR
jgi:ABC-type phosphate transport system permease subunit